MNSESGGPPEPNPEQANDRLTRDLRACPVCGTPMSRSRSVDFCPVCLMREVFSVEAQPEKASPRPQTPPPAETATTRLEYEHYRLVLQPNGTPVELGRGGMGVTYKAVDSNLNRTVALKVINSRFLGDEDMRDRFLREARAAASLRHRNVASVYHLGRADNDFFYAMELVEGEPLDRMLRFRGPLEPDLALEVVDQVAAALSAAYRQNLIHRDIKPSNLMVELGPSGNVEVKVIDFGLAKALRTSPTADRPSGMFVGTPHYASPEQCGGKDTDIRSDIYSVGITLWEMLTGRVPFEGAPTEMLDQHLRSELPLEKLEHVPAPLVQLLKRLLAKDPDQRPQNPLELQRLVRETREACRKTVITRTVPGERRRRLPILLLGAGISLGLGLCAWVWWWAQQAFTPGPDPRSVAVLPFETVGVSDVNDYLTDGLTTEVIFQLSQLRDLRVIARSSVMKYKPDLAAGRKPLSEIGRELNVAAVMESSVQRLADRLKIVVILYDAKSQKRIWGASYDREMKDLFAIQTDVAENIASALKASLSQQERDNISRQPTSNASAYDLYLQGVAFYELRQKEDNDKAVDLFRLALANDPTFTMAQAGLANCYLERRIRFGGEDYWVDSAIDLCQKAITMNPKEIRAYTTLARIYLWLHDYDRAKTPVQQALALAPNDEEVLVQASNVLPITDSRKYAFRRKCIVIDPGDARHPYFLARLCLFAGMPDLANQWMKRAIGLEPDPAKQKVMQAVLLASEGNFHAANSLIQKVDSSVLDFDVSAGGLRLACACAERDWETVRHLATVLLTEDPEDDLVRVALAEADLSLNQREEAEKVIQELSSRAEKAIETTPKSLNAQYLLLIVDRLKGNKQAAYDRLQSIYPAVLNVPFLPANDPTFRIFEQDEEFQPFREKLETVRQQMQAEINEIEKSYRPVY
jgi:TolB-like protein/lipopolysaccharide biosynthesis regulator YciM